jgi:hypothetical protein
VGVGAVSAAAQHFPSIIIVTPWIPARSGAGGAECACLPTTCGTSRACPTGERSSRREPRAAGTSRSSEPAPAAIVSARLLLGLYLLAAVGSIALSSAALLYLWVGPALLGQPFLRLYLLAEHTGCPLVASMLENSRTTRSLAPIRRLAWNTVIWARKTA